MEVDQLLSELPPPSQPKLKINTANVSKLQLEERALKGQINSLSGRRAKLSGELSGVLSQVCVCVCGWMWMCTPRVCVCVCECVHVAMLYWTKQNCMHKSVTLDTITNRDTLCGNNKMRGRFITGVSIHNYD